MTVTAEPSAPPAPEAPAAVEVPESAAEGVEDPFAENLDRLNRDQLRDLLRELGLPVPNSLRKDDLIQWVRTARSLRGDGPRAIEAPVPPALEETPSSVIPAAARWDQIQQMAAYLAKSNLTPESLRGKPHELGHVLLKANDLGVPLTAAIDQMYVIQGRVGMESKLMRALIRRDGHHVKDLGCDGFRSRVWGKRADNGDEHVGEFTLDDAVDYELIKGYKAADDGSGKWIIEPITVSRRDGSGTYEPKPQWRRDTRNMLTERATGRLARFLFSECLAGVTYTPDELDFGYLEEAGVGAPRAPGAPEPTITVDQQRSEIARRIEELPDDLKALLRETWKARRLPKPADLRPAAIRTALGLLEDAERKAEEREEEAKAHIEDADLADDGESAQPCAGCDSTVSLCSDGTWGHDEPGHGDHEPRPRVAEPDGVPSGEDASGGLAPDATEGGEDGPGAQVAGDADRAPTPAVDTAATGEALGAAPSAPPPSGTAEAAPPDALVCVGCGEEIEEGQALVWDDQERPYHASCSPFL